MAVEKELGAGGAAARPTPRATRDLERHVGGVKGRSRCMTTGRRRPRGAAQSRQRRRLGGDHLWRWRDRQAGGRTGTWMGSTGFDAEHQSPPTKESRALSEQRRHAVKARPGDIDDLGLGDLWGTSVRFHARSMMPPPDSINSFYTKWRPRPSDRNSSPAWRMSKPASRACLRRARVRESGGIGAAACVGNETFAKVDDARLM